MKIFLIDKLKIFYLYDNIFYFILNKNKLIKTNK